MILTSTKKREGSIRILFAIALGMSKKKRKKEMVCDAGGADYMVSILH